MNDNMSNLNVYNQWRALVVYSETFISINVWCNLDANAKVRYNYKSVEVVDPKFEFMNISGIY